MQTTAPAAPAGLAATLRYAADFMEQRQLPGACLDVLTTPSGDQRALASTIVHNATELLAWTDALGGTELRIERRDGDYLVLLNVTVDGIRWHANAALDPEQFRGVAGTTWQRDPSGRRTRRGTLTRAGLADLAAQEA